MDSLRREVLACMKAQSDWLDGLTVALPAGSESRDWRKQVDEMLVDLGVDGVDIRVVEAAGPPWIQTTATRPGWT
ncbi:MAG: hypothetical protein ACJARS_003667 [bacterium]|jgi:hypothetical protein